MFRQRLILCVHICSVATKHGTRYFIATMDTPQNKMKKAFPWARIEKKDSLLYLHEHELLRHKTKKDTCI